jgi:histidine triad (HIT) family protein
MQECLFCKIIKGEIASEICYRDDKVIALKDIKPQAPVHLLIIPKKHISTLLELREEDKELVGHIYSVANQLAKRESLARSGFRVVANCGPDSGQEVFHIHFHLLAGRKFAWPPG